MGVTVLVGTTKGGFLLKDGPKWTVEGPICDGWPINHMLGDPDSGAIWAAGGGDWHGAGVWRSQDGGQNWSLSKLAGGQVDAWVASEPEVAAQLGLTVGQPAPFTDRIAALWSLGRANGTLYAGAKPATLFASTDGGENWV